MLVEEKPLDGAPIEAQLIDAKEDSVMEVDSGVYIVANCFYMIHHPTVCEPTFWLNVVYIPDWYVVFYNFILKTPSVIFV